MKSVTDQICDKCTEKTQYHRRCAHATEVDLIEKDKTLFSCDVSAMGALLIGDAVFFELNAQNIDAAKHIIKDTIIKMKALILIIKHSQEVLDNA